MLETEKGGQAEIDPVIYSISEHWRCMYIIFALALVFQISVILAYIKTGGGNPVHKVAENKCNLRLK